MANAPGLAQVFAPILANRDFIVFDQRGVGLSDPALECPETVQVQFDFLTERDIAAAVRANDDAWMACRDRLVGDGYNLAAYTTQQNAADVNAIRVALGYDEVNLWGGSCGSHLAQAVMRDHPEGIRSVVLESVWPLEVSFFVETARTVPGAILKLMDACAVDDDCDRAFPNLQEVLFEVIDRLNAEPVPIKATNPRDGQKYDALLTGDAVLANLTAVPYQTMTMPTVPQAIYDVYNGNYTLMTQLSSLRLAHAELVSRGMQMSVVCTDDLIGRMPDEIRDIHEGLPNQLVGEVDAATAVEFGIFGICSEWPVRDADPSVKDPAVSDIPSPILSGEFDHVTPSEFARLVAGHLSSSYLSAIPGAGHSGESTTPCALDITASFINDPTTAPDAACLAELPGLVFVIPTAGGM